MTHINTGKEVAVSVSYGSTLFQPDRLALLDPTNIPQHIAIIPDGNRRWAKRSGVPFVAGHWEGAEVVTEIVRAASELGVQTLTVYAFSTENWNRPTEEVEALMVVFEAYLKEKKEQMVQDGIRLESIGDLSKLPCKIQEAFYETQRATAHCKKINLVLAMNYGGRDEIRRALVKIFEQNEKKKFLSEDVTENLISHYLDTYTWGDPELMIRTSGELRVSNFLLWQMSYAEIYVTEVLWPEFCAQELLEAVLVYQKRNRRVGGGEVL